MLGCSFTAVVKV